MAVDETANLNVIVKLSGDDAATRRFNALVDKFKQGKMSINEFTEAIRIGTKVYNSWDDANEKLKPGLASTIKMMKNSKSQAVDPLTSSQGKLMKSYFSLGQEMRQWFIQQRVGDRLMRESSQTVGMLGNVLGAGGLSNSLNIVTGAFQQFEYATVFAGKSMQQMGGQIGALGKNLVGMAGWVGGAIAAIMLISDAFKQQAEQVVKLHEAHKRYRAALLASVSGLDPVKQLSLLKTGAKEAAAELAKVKPGFMEKTAYLQEQVLARLTGGLVKSNYALNEYHTKFLDASTEDLQARQAVWEFEYAEIKKAITKTAEWESIWEETAEGSKYLVTAAQDLERARIAAIQNPFYREMATLAMERKLEIKRANDTVNTWDDTKAAIALINERYNILEQTARDSEWEKEHAQHQIRIDWLKERYAFYQREFNLTGKMNQQFLPTIQPGGAGTKIDLKGKLQKAEGFKEIGGEVIASGFKDQFAGAQDEASAFTVALADGLSNATSGLANGLAQAFNLGDSLLAQFANSMLSTLAQVGAKAALKGILGLIPGGGALAALFASGGDVVPGGGQLAFAAGGGTFKYGGQQNVIVGERGAELMQVGMNGVRVHSNERLQQLKSIRQQRLTPILQPIQQRVDNNLSAVNTMAQSARYGSTMTSQQPVVLETRIRGNDIVLVQAKASLSRQGRTM